jgi:AAA+ superfamily predicted ATPase
MSRENQPLTEIVQVNYDETGIQQLHINVETVSEILAELTLKTRRKLGDDSTIRDFLRTDADSDDDSFDFINETEHYDGHESPIRRYCVMKVLENRFNTEYTTWVDDFGCETSARWQTVEIHRESKQSIPKQMYSMMTSKADGSKWIVRYQTWEDNECQMTIYTRQPHDEVRDLWIAFSDYFVESGPLAGECFTPQWEYVQTQNKEWKDIILSDEVKDKIDLNVVDFFTHLNKYEEAGLSTSRGVLLSGKPGTGKTLTLDVIMNQFSYYTRIYATAETLCGLHHIRDMYAVARKLSPCIVFIEDIDTIGSSDDEEPFRTPLLGEILTALNSVERNDGILTIATTNYPDALDIALRDRPGRFDVRINFELPDKDARESILKNTLKGFSFKKGGINLKEIVMATDDFSGAWLTELIQTSFSYALRDNKKSPQITQNNIIDALKVVKESRSSVKRIQDDSGNPMY